MEKFHFEKKSSFRWISPMVTKWYRGEFHVENHNFNFKLSFEHFTLLKRQKGCEKWILQKILHRYSDSKKISTFFFDRKKIIFENDTYFFENGEYHTV